jgi:RHH-type transcriptional regulator, proline utilization regulon repressor / proline dehydrogenase / delta 1-pyrroline-5-carboxylate dehydrogenase
MTLMLDPSVPMVLPSLEESVRRFGREIFRAIGRENPSVFRKNYWSAKMMEWSMTKPSLKRDLFRLVDVLPSLRSSEAIAEHVRLYLGDAANELHSLLGWSVRGDPKSLRAKVLAVAVRKGVREMASQFIAGETPSDALRELRRIRRSGMAFTADLLGEYCVSEREAQEYLSRYLECLTVFSRRVPSWPESAPLLANHPGERTPLCISVKLSALYSQCNVLNFERTVQVLSERLRIIAQKAREVRAQVYVDAEDSSTNFMVFEAFKRVFGSPEFRDFPYPGIVVQAYAKRSRETLEDLIAFAKERNGPIAVRLVKGAYWDQETVLCRQNHWESPLFSVKESTDANYEALSTLLLDNIHHVLPAFGSHNIRSLSHACCYAERHGITKQQYELQMLYGMAEPIARAFVKEGYLVRLYVPLGEMLPGMGYLVRRLLENTSNESFLKHTFFDAHDVDDLLRAPQFRE